MWTRRSQVAASAHWRSSRMRTVAVAEGGSPPPLGEGKGEGPAPVREVAGRRVGPLEVGEDGGCGRGGRGIPSPCGRGQGWGLGPGPGVRGRALTLTLSQGERGSAAPHRFQEGRDRLEEAETFLRG